MTSVSRLKLAIIGLFLVSVIVPISSAGAVAPGGSSVSHCVTPTGIDLNERYGLDSAIVAPFCTEIGSGQKWSPSAVWTVNTQYDAMPADFVPAGETPLDDFLAKFQGAWYVVDAGSAQEREYAVPDAGGFTIADIDGAVFINSVTALILHPLSVGTHTVDVYWSWLSSIAMASGIRSLTTACRRAHSSWRQ